MLTQYAERRDELEEQYERDDLVRMFSSSRETILDLLKPNALLFFKGEALFTPLRVGGNTAHRDPRGKTTKVAVRRRGHHIAKTEGVSRTYRGNNVQNQAMHSSVFFSFFQHLRTHNLPRPLLRPKPPAALVALPPTPKRPEPDPEVLGALYDIRTTPYRNSFLWRLNGFVVHRPPVVVAVDWEVRSPWMDLMEDIRAHYALKLYGPFNLSRIKR